MYSVEKISKILQERDSISVDEADALVQNCISDLTSLLDSDSDETPSILDAEQLIYDWLIQ